jgi:hypothetical protein
MAKIVNRDLDSSEQKKTLPAQVRGTVTGTSHVLAIVPFASQCLGAFEAAVGLSGSPTHRIDVLRFIAGTGVTVITGLFNVTPVTAVGTSGVFGMSLIGGSSFLLQANDVLFLTPGGTNAAVVSTNIDIVIQGLQDIKQTHGLSNS